MDERNSHKPLLRGILEDAVSHLSEINTDGGTDGGTGCMPLGSEIGTQIMSRSQKRTQISYSWRHEDDQYARPL